MNISSRVPGDKTGCTLLDYISFRFTYHSKEEWLTRMTEGRFTVNGVFAQAHQKLHSGDTVAYDMPDFDEPPADFNYTIVHEDEWLLGVNKPGNLLVHRSGKSFRNNLMHHIRYVRSPAYPEAYVVNRLDRETSGVVLCARGKEHLKVFHEMFSDRRVIKEYLAVVRSVPAESTGTWDWSLTPGLDSEIPYKWKVCNIGGTSASTSYKVIQTLGADYALLSITIHTGRTHQIRVHAEKAGHPIVGDKLYGISREEHLAWREHPEQDASREGFSRQALHCHRLTFVHPVTKGECIIVAPLAKDIVEFFGV
jgi:RluA family pseudouridine synthase